MRCKSAEKKIPLLSDSSSWVESRLRRHVAKCLHCQRELVRFNSLVKQVSSMRYDKVAIPRHSLENVLSSVEIAIRNKADESKNNGRVFRYIILSVLGALVASSVFGLTWILRKKAAVTV